MIKTWEGWFFTFGIFSHVRYFLLLSALSFLAISCSGDPAPEPLEAAREKLAGASSIAFEMESIWNNTFIQDTFIDSPHRAHYIKREREGFGYDFVYQTDGFASVYKDGQLEDIDIDKRQLIVYSPGEAEEDLAYEGSYVSMMSPMEMIKDTAWKRAGKDGNVVLYEKVMFDERDDEGHKYTFARLKIDSLSSEIISREQFYSIDGKPTQHLVSNYSVFRFNEPDSLFYLYPEGLSTIAKTDLEKQRDNEGLKPGDTFPLFDLVDASGQAYSSESVKGRKLVFAFSFIGCGGCEYARKELAKAEFEFKDEYLGFYVNPTNPMEQIISYHAEKPWPFKMAAVDYDFSKRYGVYAYPTFITVDESGKVLEVVEGYEESYFSGKGKSR